MFNMTKENYKSMSMEELESLSKKLTIQQNEVLKELARRGWGKNSPDDMEHSDMLLTENDF